MKYRKEIDGLRALAVLPVILFHAGFTTFSGGFVGVDIFFVISGYLITTIIVDEMDKGSFSLLNFYERRARRILPALFFVMLCTLPFAWFWMLPQDLKSFSQSLVAVPLFASNVLFWLTSGYFETASELKPLLHTWSLAVEEQYYVLFPLFLMLAWKLGKKWIISLLIIVAIVSVSAAQYGSTNHPSFTFYLLPTRAFEILIGALISLYINHKQSIISVSQSVSQSVSLAGLALVLYAIFAFDKNTPSPSLFTLIPTVGAGLILVFANNKNIVGKLLGSKLFVGIGLISYSAYLWHQPLLAFARLRSIDELTSPILIALCLSSLALGYLSWKFIENPFRNKTRIKLRTLVLTTSTLAFVFILLGLAGHFGKGFSGRIDEKITAISNIPKYYESIREDDICFNSTLKSKLLNCVKGNTNIPPDVMLLGDSHAASLTLELANRFKLINKSFLNETKSGCLPIREIRQWPDNECAEFINSALNEAQQRNIKTIIIVARWAYYITDDGFNNGEGGVESRGLSPNSVTDIDKTKSIEIRKKAILFKIKENIQSLISQGFNIILVYPIPQNGWTPSDRLAKILFFNSTQQNLSTSHSKFITDTKEIYETLDDVGKSTNLHRVFPENIFCNTKLKNRCFTSISDTIFYYDDDHLSNEGAKLVVDEVMKFVK